MPDRFGRSPRPRGGPPPRRATVMITTTATWPQRQHVTLADTCHDSKHEDHVSPRGNPLRRGSRRPTPSPRLVGPRVACTGGPCGGRTGWRTRRCPSRGGSPTNGSTSVACRGLRPHARRRPPRRTLCLCWCPSGTTTSWGTPRFCRSVRGSPGGPFAAVTWSLLTVSG